MVFQQKDLHSKFNQNKMNALKSRPVQGNAINDHFISNSHLFYLEDVSVRFGNINALSNITLKVNRNEILFITGPSGAGKTTLLKVLSGHVGIDHGKMVLPSPSKVFTSQVFQELRLIPEQTCLEAMMMAYDPVQYNGKADFKEDLNELCSFMGIQDRLGLKLAKANGGLKQKVAIIRALLSRPDVFIADEPTSSLDFNNAKRLFELLNLYNTKRGTTVIWASHNSELVKRFSGRIVHLQGGKLVYSGHACFI